uniref:Uncharacterized protein n=1 Tax=Solanum lycopersicum TaxID=4081 RepID=A0A3Q7FQU5_SOLLC
MSRDIAMFLESIFVFRSKLEENLKQNLSCGKSDLENYEKDSEKYGEAGGHKAKHLEVPRRGRGGLGQGASRSRRRGGGNRNEKTEAGAQVNTGNVQYNMQGSTHSTTKGDRTPALGSRRTEEARFAEEPALALAEKEKAKSRAAVEQAEAA